MGHILSEGNMDLAGIYMPYFVVPALIATKMAIMPDPFPSTKRKSSKRD